MIKAILFDMDGVVIDSEPLYEKAGNVLFERYGISIPPEEQKDLKGVTELEFYRRIEARYRPGWDREQVIKEGQALVRKILRSELELMPGVTSLIDRLKKSYFIGLVTSTPKHLVDDICRIVPFKDMFQEIVSADDISNGKPHPEPYLTMMQRLRVDPEEVVVVEDSLHGITSAKASGALCIALASSFEREELKAADAVVESLDEIDDTLLRALQSQRSTRHSS